MPQTETDLLEALYDEALRLSTERTARHHAQDAFGASCCERNMRRARDNICDLAERLYQIRNS